MQILEKEVQHIAHLAHIAVSPAEITSYTQELDSVLTYMEQLSEVDVIDVQATNQVTGLENVFRSDVMIETDQEIRDAIIAQFSISRGGLLEVPAIFV